MNSEYEHMGPCSESNPVHTNSLYLRRLLTLLMLPSTSRSPKWSHKICRLELCILSYVQWLNTGFVEVGGFIELIQIVTSSNYSALANSRNPQLTIEHTNSSQFIFASGCLVTDFNIILFCSRRYRLVTVSHPAHSSKCPLSTHDWLVIYNLGTDRTETLF
jgi:hypothetical protein